MVASLQHGNALRFFCTTKSVRVRRPDELGFSLSTVHDPAQKRPELNLLAVATFIERSSSPPSTLRGRRRSGPATPQARPQGVRQWRIRVGGVTSERTLCFGCGLEAFWLQCFAAKRIRARGAALGTFEFEEGRAQL